MARRPERVRTVRPLEQTKVMSHVKDYGTLISERLLGRYAGLLGRRARVDGDRPENVPSRGRNAASPVATIECTHECYRDENLKIAIRRK